MAHTHREKSTCQREKNTHRESTLWGPALPLCGDWEGKDKLNQDWGGKDRREGEEYLYVCK
jgi:hypothetical protein